MRAAAGAITAAGLALSACQQSANQPASSNAGQPVNAGPGETPPVIVPPATGPDARTPLAEPKDAIDPKSAEAAAQVVQHYGALVEQARFSEAESLWSDAAAAKAFPSQLQPHPEMPLETGNPGTTEGAAGSIYVTVPVVVYGKLKGGDQFRHPASVILRRVNDVPGSTETQRRWHIERIELASVD